MPWEVSGSLLFTLRFKLSYAMPWEAQLCLFDTYVWSLSCSEQILGSVKQNTKRNMLARSIVGFQYLAAVCMWFAVWRAHLSASLNCTNHVSSLAAERAAFVSWQAVAHGQENWGALRHLNTLSICCARNARETWICSWSLTSQPRIQTISQMLNPCVAT
jgi:hypothetical protein